MKNRTGLKIKNHAYLILATVFVAKLLIVFMLGCAIRVFSQSADAAEIYPDKKIYPDYSLEFAGEDKWENFNRKMFTFNLKANKYVLKPINIVWSSVMPQYGMDRIESFYTNLKYPIRLAGCLLQKDFKSSGTETSRFFINTTLGIAGLYDPALKKFNIEPRDEDVAQALAHFNMAQGNYLVLPIVAQGNTRDIIGQLLDLPLNPTSYIIGPVALASTGLSVVNTTTYFQPIAKMAESYADPYEVSKQLVGMSNYLKNTNLDRSDVFEEKTQNENIVPINNVQTKNLVQPDITLENYNPQSPLVDSMRTILFDNQKIDSSAWAELSVWNKTFIKKLKTASVEIDYLKPKYTYRYVLQKDKRAPLAFIFPSIGEGIMSSESAVQAKLLYDEGYSVVILSSAFNWEFVKSMPNGYNPGLPTQDALYLRKTVKNILTAMQLKYGINCSNKIIVGNSFGAMTALYTASQEEKDNTLGISKYVVINPPIELLFAMKQLDKCFLDYSEIKDVKEQAAIVSKKIIQLTTKVQTKNNENIEDLPFTQDEAKFAISYALRQKLSDTVFEIEKSNFSKSSEFYQEINSMNYSDYAQRYLISKQNKQLSELQFESALYSISDFIKTADNIKIYHTADDFFTNPEQIYWLKSIAGDKCIIFDHGSHLGFLYRKEFLNEFKKDIKTQTKSL